MTKHMSKTLAAELADRVLGIVNPQNRPLALNAALTRHGFAATQPPVAEMADRGKIIAWLIATYAAR